jgi:hypothetical protein
MCHNGRKVTDELDNLKLDRVPRPLYSPDMSPRDFWLFGILKQKSRIRYFDSFSLFHRVWDELTLEDMLSIFFN